MGLTEDLGAFVTSIFTQMLCFENPEDVTLFGRYGLQDGKILLIDIDRCYEKEKNCKSDNEIEEFFQTHNLGMLYSTIEY